MTIKEKIKTLEEIVITCVGDGGQYLYSLMIISDFVSSSYRSPNYPDKESLDAARFARESGELNSLMTF